MASKITARQLLAALRKYVGVKESPPNSNNVIFNTRYYGRPVSGSQYPWCVAFLWFCFDELGANDLFFGGKKTASCGALMRDAQSRGQWISDAKALSLGDLAIFDFENNARVDTNHVGFVVSNDGRALHTIEGNTSAAGSQSNGGEVMEKTRAYSLCIGGVRPAYLTEDSAAPMPILRRGAKGDDVRKLQERLHALKFPCGSVDGDFGPRTLEAVKAFQASRGLFVDGEVGPLTWGS
jgi:Putative peptidoglycan-binding domain-containing protein